MIQNFRTDLASEAQRIWLRSANENSSLNGVIAREEILFGKNVTSVEILNNEGASALGKPIGNYYTLELPQNFERAAEQFSDCVYASSKLIRRCLNSRPNSVLVAALGNPNITPDSLGSLTGEYTLVTRHMKRTMPNDFSAFSSLSLCRTGVLGTSGIESAAHIRMLADSIKPDAIIAIDALAGAESERLCKTLQFTDTGISPGSGVGNDREELNIASLGIPVIAIGMPTVIDVGSFSPSMAGMFVTPRNIDSVVRSAARIIGYAINIAVHDISIKDADMLL